MTTRWHAGLFVFFILSGIAGMSSPARGEQDSEPTGEQIQLHFHSTPGKHESANPQWSGITFEQIIKHLKLEGSNASLTFKQPVYLRLREMMRTSKQSAAEQKDFWSDKSAMELTLSVIVEEKEPPSKGADGDFYRGVVLEWSRNNDRPIKPEGLIVSGKIYDSMGVRWGRTVILKTKNYRRAERAVWQNRPDKIELEEEVLLYEFYDPDAPTESFYRLTALFTATPPPSKPDPAAESKQE